MDVGKGQIISDKWIPQGLDTGLLDINGVEIKTRNKVKLNGCTSLYAIIGKDMYGKFVLYFGSDDASVSWGLDQETIDRHKVRVVKE